MNRLTIRINKSLYNRFSFIAFKKGIPKSKLLTEWLKYYDYEELVFTKREVKTVSYTFYIEESINATLDELSYRFNVSKSAHIYSCIYINICEYLDEESIRQNVSMIVLNRRSEKFNSNYD